MPGSRCSGSVRIAPVMSLGALFLPFTALADGGAATREADSGHTAWVLVATALVLLMTLPGLALFYGGMVRRCSSPSSGCSRPATPSTSSRSVR